jgi:HK97 family phage major capsid protein
MRKTKMELNSKSNTELETEIEALESKALRIRDKADKESRDLSSAEESLISDLKAHAADLRHELLSRPERPLTVPGSGPLGDHSFGADREPYALIGPNGRKDYKSMFGNAGLHWTDKDSNFFSAVFSGRYHPGLFRNAMTEGTGSDGGFLVPVEQVEKIHAVSLENEIVQPRCYVQPMKSNTIKIPAMSIGDHSTALFGGFTASYTAELGTISEHDPKCRSMELNAKKLTGLIRFSSELNADTPGGMNQIETLCGKGLAWYRDKAFLKGSGAGQPLGILNADCLVEVDPEAGQGTTIVYENLTKMMSRLFAGSFSNSVWVCHQSCIPQLLTLSLAVGVGGGGPIPVMSQANGQFTILTRPVIFTEKTEPLGTKGDILLADFSQYVVGLRSEMRFDTSIHVAFTTDEILARIIERHDGQPPWDSALTLEDGSTTVSPFVVLGDR